MTNNPTEGAGPTGRERELLYQVYGAINSAIRVALPLDDDWPQELTDAYDAIGDYLFPDPEAGE